MARPEAVLPHLLPLNEPSGPSKCVALGSGFEIVTADQEPGAVVVVSLFRLEGAAYSVVAGPLVIDPEQHVTMGQVLSALLTTVGANMRFYQDGSAQIVYLDDKMPRALLGMHLFTSYLLDDEGDHCWQFEVPRSMISATNLGLFDPVMLPNQRIGRVGSISGFAPGAIVKGEPVCRVMVLEDRAPPEALA